MAMCTREEVTGYHDAMLVYLVFIPKAHVSRRIEHFGTRQSLHVRRLRSLLIAVTIFHPATRYKDVRGMPSEVTAWDANLEAGSLRCPLEVSINGFTMKLHRPPYPGNNHQSMGCSLKPLLLVGATPPFPGAYNLLAYAN
jgi:hypothetical protein